MNKYSLNQLHGGKWILAKAKQIYGLLSFERKDAEKGKAFLQESLEMYKEIFPPGHPKIVNIISFLKKNPKGGFRFPHINCVIF